jgi:ferredoxin
MEQATERSSRVEVDRSRCTGLGICELQAPGHFEVQDDGVVEVRRAEASPEQLAAVHSAVESCPNQALRFVDQS